jgi:hypothetical protein
MTIELSLTSSIIERWGRTRRSAMTLNLFGCLIFTSAAALVRLGGSILLAVTALANPLIPRRRTRQPKGLL